MLALLMLVEATADSSKSIIFPRLTVPVLMAHVANINQDYNSTVINRFILQYIDLTFLFIFGKHATLPIPVCSFHSSPFILQEKR